MQPNDANVSTDLGVAYYYTDQPDRAIQQFEQSLKIDPKHTKTMLNMGIVKAFGKQDLSGAADAWRQVIATAPQSQEAEAARKALEGLHSRPTRAGRRRLPRILGSRRGVGILLRVALLLVMVVVAVRAAARFMAGLSQGMRQQGDAPRQVPPVKMVKDPVCGTFVVPGKALSAASGGTTVWFCSEACRDQYARRG
ncbi:MAG: tetratricopeptide repeat protein [Vicinamibacterales bacterium]